MPAETGGVALQVQAREEARPETRKWLFGNQPPPLLQQTESFDCSAGFPLR